jgi:hypothetical protein
MLIKNKLLWLVFKTFSFNERVSFYICSTLIQSLIFQPWILGANFTELSIKHWYFKIKAFATMWSGYCKPWLIFMPPQHLGWRFQGWLLGQLQGWCRQTGVYKHTWQRELHGKDNFSSSTGGELQRKPGLRGRGGDRPKHIYPLPVPLPQGPPCSPEVSLLPGSRWKTKQGGC